MRQGEQRFDTHKEKNADDREFAEARARHDAEHATTKYVPAKEWKEQPYPPLRAGTKGTNTANHPSRAVHREVFDKTTVSNAYGEPMTRTNVSRYDEAGNFLSQGYTEEPRGDRSQPPKRRG